MAEINNGAPTASLFFGMRFFTGDGGVLFRYRLMFDVGVDSGVTDNEGIIAVPAGATEAQPFLLMDGTTGQMNGGYRFTHAFIRKMADAELIVDGAVTAD